jgi:hypothetical protein
VREKPGVRRKGAGSRTAAPTRRTPPSRSAARAPRGGGGGAQTALGPGRAGRAAARRSRSASPEGLGSYRAAYGRLAGEGTAARSWCSGPPPCAPNLFGLTHRPTRRPSRRDGPALRGRPGRGAQAVVLEDYCHAGRRSIEFQVVFLRTCWARRASCRALWAWPRRSAGGRSRVARFLEPFARCARRDVLFVLGMDPAHLGPLWRSPARPGGEVCCARSKRATAPASTAFDRRRRRLLVARRLPGDALSWWDVAFLHLPARRPVLGQVLTAVADRSRERRELRRAGLYDALAPEDE